MESSSLQFPHLCQTEIQTQRHTQGRQISEMFFPTKDNRRIMISNPVTVVSSALTIDGLKTSMSWIVLGIVDTSLELLDSERMVGHGTPIKDNTYLNIPEKEFSISIAYFSQNLHFVFHSKFEFPSLMEADLCNKFLSAHRQAAQKIINMRIQDKVRSASIMEGNSKFK